LTGNSQTIAEAYRHLFTIQDAVKQGRTADTSIRESLTFLTLAGRSDVLSSAIDCEYCFEYGLDTLRDNSRTVAGHHGSVWAAYGMLLSEFLERVEKNSGRCHDIDADKGVRIGWFSEELRLNSWPVRSDIIAGFTVLAKRHGVRGDAFWRVVRNIHQAFTHAGNERSTSADIRNALTAYARLWEALTNAFGSAQDVRNHLGDTAFSVLALLRQHEAPLDAFNNWKRALLNLRLPVVAPTPGWGRTADGHALQAALDRIVEEIDRIRENHPGTPIGEWADEISADFIPYLHGRAAREDRIIRPEVNASALFLSAGSLQGRRMVVHIGDVCRQGRGFYIDTNAPVPVRKHMGSLGQWQRAVQTKPVEGERLQPIDEVILYPELPDPVTGEVRPVEVPCNILRAWPQGETEAGWVLHASSELPPEGWRDWGSFAEAFLASSADLVS